MRQTGTREPFLPERPPHETFVIRHRDHSDRTPVYPGTVQSCPANRGIPERWSLRRTARECGYCGCGSDEIVVGFSLGYFKNNPTGRPDPGPDKPRTGLQVRNLDSGSRDMGHPHTTQRSNGNGATMVYHHQPDQKLHDLAAMIRDSDACSNRSPAQRPRDFTSSRYSTIVRFSHPLFQPKHQIVERNTLRQKFQMPVSASSLSRVWIPRSPHQYSGYHSFPGSMKIQRPGSRTPPAHPHATRQTA